LSEIGIVADIHANLPAAEAVLRHAGDLDAWWCAGDTVGYGPFPNECISLVSRLEAACVVGNHDLGSIGAISLERFNPDARLANEWTRGVLGELEAACIAGLATARSLLHDAALLVHGSPRDPVWEYILSPEQAYRSFLKLENRLCFHGHSHSPAVFRWPLEAQESGDRDALEFAMPSDALQIELEEGTRYLIDAGSVGQPRDGDPRACYVTFRPEEGALSFHRVEYDVQSVQKKMEEVGLPAFLSSRLAVGR